MGNRLGYFVAFTIGGATGVLATKTYFEKKYKNIADEEIESIKTSYFIEKMNNDRDEARKNIENDDTNKEFADYVDISSIYSNPVEEKTETIAMSDVEKDYYAKHLAESERPMDDTAEEPYEISEEIFSETELGYDKFTLQYFVEDDILYDPLLDSVPEGQTIGDEGINRVRTSNDVYTLYFRNDNYGCDYEVVKIAGSYYGD